MVPLKTLLRGGRVVTPALDADAVADVLFDTKGIAEVGPDLAAGKAKVVDCDGLVVLPGLADVHTHLREPGREDEETVASGTRAAAAGGFTAVCPMPNTEPACDTGSAVRFLRERGETEGVVRVLPIGAVTKGREGASLAEMGDMVAEGAVAFSDDGDGVSDAGMMRLAMDYAKRFDVPLVSHAEDPSLSAGGVVNEGVVSTRLGLPGWPSAAEEVMVARDIRLAELTGCRLHLAHLSTAGSVALVREAKAAGLPVTCEVTPHHLFLSEEALLTYDTDLKINPPLRTEEDRAALVEALSDGTVDCIATDHAPHAPHEKDLEFELAPFGTTGLETALALVVTHLVEGAGMGWSAVAELMCHGPRAALGLPEAWLGSGAPADITVVDPARTWRVEAGGFVGKSRNSAFMGHQLTGRAEHVVVGGRFALKDGKVVA